MCVCLMPEAFYKKGCKNRAPQEYPSLSRGYNQPKIRSAYKSMMSVSEERLDSTKIGQELKLIQITIKIIITLSKKSYNFIVQSLVSPFLK